MQGQRGTSMGAVESSPTRRKRQAAKRRAEEKGWASKASAVTVRRVEPIGDTPSEPPRR